MKRIRGRGLVLINWKGVFYERYTLDEHVTALEGDNGAGKTTVMIAAYVVLLPDMTRLRFSNVGESDATGGDKGVWGRLGNPNRPSYAIVSFDLAFEQVLAGVHLERKGEPSVELIPFMISGLPAGTRLQEALLLRAGDQDLVPELNELRENVARLGAQLEVFRTAKDYFARLFERGITPLRLIAEDERSRFNDMLRTSMTGGISRALTSEFRSFLLKEETGLGDTLLRMRANLDACRRTRSEVEEARRLEQEISGIYEAGHEMFALALLATRERAEELRRRFDEAKEARDAAARAHYTVAGERLERDRQREDVRDQLSRAKGEYEGAREQEGRVVGANTIAKRISDLDRRLFALAENLAGASTMLSRAEEQKSRCATERIQAEEAYRRAAEGLANLQRGLDELHRRADAHRTVTVRLEEARARLALSTLPAEDVEAHREAARDTLADVDRKRSKLDEAISSAEVHLTDYNQAKQALELVLKQQIEPADAYAAARRALRDLRELEAIAERAEAFEGELRSTRSALARQQAAKARADALSAVEEPLTSSVAVRQALERAEAGQEAARQGEREERAAAEECGRMRDKVQTRLQELRSRAVTWRELDTVATRLEKLLGAGLRTAREIESARQILDEARDNAHQRRDALQRAREQATGEARNLEQTGGFFHADLIAARDLLGGELLASQFDDIEPRYAGVIQARLGPLADAIVVEDAHAAARTLGDGDRELSTIWLVEEGGLHDVMPSDATRESEGPQKDIIVEPQEGVVRTTRIPAMPTLGSRARQRLIVQLHERAEELGQRLETVDVELAEIDSHRSDTSLLNRELRTIELGDPASELADIGTEDDRLRAEIQARAAAAEEARREASRFHGRCGDLRGLLRESLLLDEPDLTSRVAELEETLERAAKARIEIERVGQVREILLERLDVLRRVPFSPEEIAAMRRELQQLGERRSDLFFAHDALSYVTDNRSALEWGDAEGALSAQKALVPALNEQCDRAESARKRAEASFIAADETWETARSGWRQLEDQRTALGASRVTDQEQLDAFGIADASDAAVGRAHELTEQLASSLKGLDESERRLGELIAELGERLKQREADLRETEERLAKEEREWKPADELWERLRARAANNGLLTVAISSRLLDVGSGSVNLRSEARGWARALVERLRKANGGDDILERIQTWLSGQEQTAGEDYLQVWAVTRDWLRRRVPAQIAEVEDPLEALERLRRHLKTLSERLDEQERRLRGASEDVARGIDVHIRSAQRQVRLLNRELEGVSFGTIRGMQIRLTRDDRMDGVLRALREGSAQALLFAPTMPVEEALDALFARFGGRGPTIGQRLLDYREYVEIAVEIQRQASVEWERVNPSRLSTGEAIGVGTALMMVVLTAWERAANLFRAKRSLGTLRLLFLDEANRLSQDNLQVLFELCSSLDLQLIIAAPEVARGAGCTTYRLVRRTTLDGGEEVIVSGRRALPRAS